MKSILLGVFFLLWAPFLPAQNPAEKKTEKKINTNIYEKESHGAVVAKVQTFRKTRDGILVFFEVTDRPKGPYLLSDGIKNYDLLQERISKSAAQNGRKVSVSINEKDEIVSVEMSEAD